MAGQQPAVAVPGAVGPLGRFPYNNQIGLKKRSGGPLRVEEMCKVL